MARPHLCSHVTRAWRRLSGANFMWARHLIACMPSILPCRGYFPLITLLPAAYLDPMLCQEASTLPLTPHTLSEGCFSRPEPTLGQRTLPMAEHVSTLPPLRDMLGASGSACSIHQRLGLPG